MIEDKSVPEHVSHQSSVNWMEKNKADFYSLVSGVCFGFALWTCSKIQLLV